MRTTIGPIRANPQTRAFLRDLMREVVAVGRAHGVGLDPELADKRLAHADGLPADMTSSMHHDFERGNRLEVRMALRRRGGARREGRGADAAATAPSPTSWRSHADGRKAA